MSISTPRADGGRDHAAEQLHLHFTRAEVGAGSLDYLHVAGVLAVGPQIDDAAVRVVFAPLAGTPGFDCALCEVEVDIAGGAVRQVSGRMLSAA